MTVTNEHDLDIDLQCKDEPARNIIIPQNFKVISFDSYHPNRQTDIQTTHTTDHLLNLDHKVAIHQSGQ